MKALGCQPVESTSPFKVLVSDVVNLHPYVVEGLPKVVEDAARDAGASPTQVVKVGFFLSRNRSHFLVVHLRYEPSFLESTIQHTMIL